MKRTEETYNAMVDRVARVLLGALVLSIGFACLMAAAGCGQQNSDDDVTFTTPLGVEVHTKAGYPPWTDSSIDDAFTAVIGEPLVVRDNDKLHTVVDTLTFSLNDLDDFGYPDLRFTKDAVVDCPIDGPVEDSGLGCYYPASVNGKAHIVVRIVPSGGMCIAEETYLNHFVAHFVQQAYGYPIDHNPPIWPAYGQNLEIIIQRWFYLSACQ